MARNPWANWPFGGIGSTSRQQPLSGDVSQWLRIFSPVEAVSKLQKIVDEVEKKKLEYQRNAADRARKALEDLREHDPAVFASVLSEFRPGGSHAAPPPIAPPVEA